MNMHEEMPKRSARKILKGGLIILLVISIAFASGLAYLKERIDTLWYPRKFQSEVEDASARFGVEPNLIYAIIKAESDFTETAVSSVGAIGLMQVLPDTFILDIREHIGLENARSAVLFEAQENILAGTYYFAHWYDHFNIVYEMDDPTVEALAAYNAGISNVWKWLEDDTLSDWKGLFVEEIPFEETREYVKRVLEYKEKYDALYGSSTMSTGRISEALCYRYAKRYGEAYKIDPRLVMAIVKAESSFNPSDVSKSGAVGLMQIIEGTYVDIQADLSLEEEFDALYDAEFNIKCGTYYLHWIDERIDGVIQIAASYNVGLNAVQGWLADPRYSADGEILLIDNIPIEQTRNYVKNVVSYYREYCERYPD